MWRYFRDEDRVVWNFWMPQGPYDIEGKANGVAIYCRTLPKAIMTGLGFADFDMEGRYIQADFGNLSIISLYMPSGSSKEERLDFKYDMMERMKPLLLEMQASGS